MKLAICDDEKRIRDMVAEAVREVSESIEIENYSDAQRILSPEFDADILFLDIQMPGTDGMKASKILRSNGKKTIIVFVTALEEQVFNAFDVGAFNYIVKPFSKVRIKDVIRGAIEQAEEVKSIEKTLAEKIKNIKPGDESPYNPRQTQLNAYIYKDMTLEQFYSYAKAFLDKDADGYTNMKRGDAFYKPMVEVIDYLQYNNFTVYI